MNIGHSWWLLGRLYMVKNSVPFSLYTVMFSIQATSKHGMTARI